MSKTLDEIIRGIEQDVRLDAANHISGDKSRDPYITKVEAKQAILQWVADEVVGDLEYNADRDLLRLEQCQKLIDHGWKQP